MADLSPAAREVMIAATNGNTNVVNDPVYRQCIAAALRAAADHLDDHANRLLFGGKYHGMIMAIELLQSIATQLEGND